MTSAQSVRRPPRPGLVPRLLGALPWLLTLLTGCAADSWKFPTPWKKAEPAVATAGDGFVMRGGGLERARELDAEGQQDLDAARKLFQEKSYDKAEPLYHKLGLDKKAPMPVAEEALFSEAECQRLQKNYRAAEGTYKLLLERFRNSQYTERANDGLFAIADYWLTATRNEMNAYEEKLAGKRSFVLPAAYFHTSKDMPFLDAEGHAMLILDTVRLNDINGRNGEKALYYMATVKFYRADYREADFYFKQLYTQYPNSEWAAKSLKQSVICKQLVAGGTVYDGRSIEEAKTLLHTAQTAYPELARDEQWTGQQLASINMQQADRDWRIAEFYRRTGHPGSAYFYYELVKRRYPGAPCPEQPGKTYTQLADERMAELKTRVEREQAAQAQPAAAPLAPRLLPWNWFAGQTPAAQSSPPATAPTVVTPLGTPQLLPPTAPRPGG